MNVFAVQDVFGVEVCLPERRWKGHVLASHPEMSSHLEAIEQAITNPQFVFQSDIDTDAKLFYRRGIVQGKYRHLFVKVAVSYATTPAIVKTAFFTDSMTGGKLLWAKFP